MQFSKDNFNKTTQSRVLKSCTTHPLNSTPTLNYIFGSNLNGNYLTPNTVYQLFKFNKNSQVYNGSYLIRGISCNAFVSCNYDPKTKTNYTAINYFSSKFFFSLYICSSKTT